MVPFCCCGSLLHHGALIDYGSLADDGSLPCGGSLLVARCSQRRWLAPGYWSPPGKWHAPCHWRCARRVFDYGCVPPASGPAGGGVGRSPRGRWDYSASPSSRPWKPPARETPARPRERSPTSPLPTKQEKSHRYPRLFVYRLDIWVRGEAVGTDPTAPAPVDVAHQRQFTLGTGLSLL